MTLVLCNLSWVGFEGTPPLQGFSRPALPGVPACEVSCNLKTVILHGSVRTRTFHTDALRQREVDDERQLANLLGSATTRRRPLIGHLRLGPTKLSLGARGFFGNPPAPGGNLIRYSRTS